MLCSFNILSAQVLFDFNFQTASMPAGLTSSGTVSTSKAADPPCTQGMVQVNQGGFFQIDAASCGTLSLNMKSTSSSVRTVALKYQKSGDASFTTLGNLSIGSAATFDLVFNYPDLATNGGIIIRLEPTSGNIQIHDIHMTASAAPSADAEITAFALPVQVGLSVINSVAGTIAVNVPLGTVISNVVPQTLVISGNASISPSASTARDFTTPQSYTVTAQNGVVVKNWTVSVAHVASSDKDITAFKLAPQQMGNAVINNAAGTIAVTMPNNVAINSIVPQILNISPNSNISPSAATARDFTTPQSYTVTAQDNSTKTWTVTVTQAPPITLDFETVKGFASIAGDGFAGPTNGGQNAPDTLVINGPNDFNILCEALYNRGRAYKTNTVQGGMKKAPLVILLKAGIYDGTQTLSTNGGKAFGNDMLDIPDQGDLTFIGQNNVVFKIGINVKRSYNIIIRNIFFQEYYDDGINVGYEETHHVWIDHCTFGHPTTLPSNADHPDGGLDVKDGASYVTISWCLYRNSWKTGLVGHSDGNGSTDIGRLKVTYYNNYYYHTNSRNPRVRFGQVHVYNCLYDSVMLYGGVAANQAELYMESNFFKNTDWAMYADRSVADFKAVFGNNTDNGYTSKTGNYPAKALKQIGNEYDDTGLPVITSMINPAMLNPGGRSVKFDELNPGIIFEPSSYYSYLPMTPADVRQVVPLYAGADKVQFGNTSSMPLTLVNFTAKATGEINKKVALSWTTEEEKNTDRFSVEKSQNGREFNAIGSVAAKNATGTHNYAFNDEKPSLGVNYYRLKMIDKDGSYTFSKIEKVLIGDKNEITVFPNPVKDILTVTYNANTNGTISIRNLEGKNVAQLKTSNAGFSAINVNNLVPGIYYAVIESGTEKQVIKFVKQ